MPATPRRSTQPALWPHGRPALHISGARPAIQISGVSASRGDAAALFFFGWGTGMVTAFRLLLYQSPVFNHNLRTTVIYRLDGYALKRHRGQSDAAADDFRVLREKLNQSAGDLRGPRQSSMSTHHDSEQHSPADLSAVSQTARFLAFCSFFIRPIQLLQPSEANRKPLCKTAAMEPCQLACASYQRIGRS